MSKVELNVRDDGIGRYHSVLVYVGVPAPITLRYGATLESMMHRCGYAGVALRESACRSSPGELIRAISIPRSSSEALIISLVSSTRVRSNTMGVTCVKSSRSSADERAAAARRLRSTRVHNTLCTAREGLRVRKSARRRWWWESGTVDGAHLEARPGGGLCDVIVSLAALRGHEPAHRSQLCHAEVDGGANRNDHII